MKWIGVLLVLSGSGSFGFMLVRNHLRSENALRQLLCALEFMECELRYRMTSLPQLCRCAAGQRTGPVRRVLEAFARELEDQVSPDVSCCMRAALLANPDLPGQTASVLQDMGQNLGRFDLEGQLAMLQSARQTCRQQLELLSRDRDSRLRGYQTLALCTGAALAILLL